MAKLYFRYGAMNSGKSSALLQAAFNYEERGHRVLLAKPAIDTKGDRSVSSRLGLTREVDLLVHPADELRAMVLEAQAAGPDPDAGERAAPRPVSCVLVDEAQFLSPRQIDDLFRVAVIDGIPVMAYGIRTDFQTVAFPGSQRLLEIAHSLEELKTICRCGRKAVFNARLLDGRFVFDGAQVAIDHVGEVTYESMCGACYLEASGGRLASDLRA